MSSVFRIEKSNIENPQEWYKDKWKCELELDQFSETEEYYVFEDINEELFMFTETENWIKIAGANHLIFGYYSEDSLSAEFVEIVNGKCIREYREYYDEEEDNVDIGDEPAFESWIDVASYVDSKLLN